MSIFRLEPSSPDFIFILLYYYILSLLTSARTRDAEHVIILLYRRTAHTHTHTHYTRVLYTDTFLLQIQPMHLRGVPIVCTVPGSHEKPVWGPEG